MTPKPKPRDLPPDWFCEGQEDLLDLFCDCGRALPCRYCEPDEGKETP